jgi:RNA polymerase sigma-70 factor (ECF subfamily)
MVEGKVNNNSSYPQVDDEELVRRIKSGDETAFGELVNKYKKRAYYTAYEITGSHHEAEDLAQEAFVKVYHGIRKFKEEANFYTWFYRIVVNLCLDHKRRVRFFERFAFVPVQKDSGQEITDIVIQDEEDTAEEKFEKRETGKRIDQALRKLPLMQRTIFIMKNSQDLKILEIAKVLKCAEGTVKSHLSRAVMKLKDELSKTEN